MPYTPSEDETRFPFSAGDSVEPQSSPAARNERSLADDLFRNPNINLTPAAKQRLRSAIDEADRAFERSCGTDERKDKCTAYMDAVYFKFLKEYAFSTAPVGGVHDSDVWIYGHLLNHVFETKWERVRWDMLPEWSIFTQHMGEAMRNSSQWPLYIQSLERANRPSTNEAPKTNNIFQSDLLNEEIPAELQERLTTALVSFWGKLAGDLGNKSSSMVLALVSEIVRYIEDQPRLPALSIATEEELRTGNEAIVTGLLDKLQAGLSYFPTLGPDLIHWPIPDTLLGGLERIIRSSWNSFCSERPERLNQTPGFQTEMLSCLRSQQRIARFTNDVRTQATAALKVRIAKLVLRDSSHDVTKLPYWSRPDPTYYFDKTDTLGLSQQERSEIKSGLLDLHSQSLEFSGGIVDRRLHFGRLTFDLFASVFAKANILHEDAVKETIPTLSLDAIVCGRWWFDRLTEPVQTRLSPVQFGHEWTSESGRNLFLSIVESRIAYWRACLIRKSELKTAPSVPKRNAARAQSIKAAVARLPANIDWKKRENLESLCQQLDSEGVPPPKSWKKKSVKTWEDQCIFSHGLVKRVINYDLGVRTGKHV